MSALIRPWVPTPKHRAEIEEWTGKQPDAFWHDLGDTVGDALARHQIAENEPAPAEVRQALKELTRKTGDLLTVLIASDDYTRMAVSVSELNRGRQGDPVGAAQETLATLLDALRFAQAAEHDRHRKGGAPRRTSFSKRIRPRLERLMQRHGIEGPKADGCIEAILSRLSDKPPRK